MATTPVFVSLPSGVAGMTLSLSLQPSVGDLDPSIANGAGDTLVELTNMLGWYKADVTEALDGVYIGTVDAGGAVIKTVVFVMADTTTPVFESSLEQASLRGEPGQGAPAEYASTLEKIDYLYKYMVNRGDQDGTTFSLWDYAGTQVDQKRDVTDTGPGGFTSRAQLVSGP